MTRKNTSATAKPRRRTKARPDAGPAALATAAAVVQGITRAGDERLKCLLSALADRDTAVVAPA